MDPVRVTLNLSFHPAAVLHPKAQLMLIIKIKMKTKQMEFFGIGVPLGDVVGLRALEQAGVVVTRPAETEGKRLTERT